MKRRRRGSDEGTVAIEAALLLPVFLLALLGVIEFGAALWQWNTMLLAVEQAGRWAMINNSDSNLVADVENQMQAVLPSAAVCTAPKPGQICVNVSSSAGTPSTMTLTASYNFNLLALFGPFTLTSQGTVPLD